MQNCFLIKKSYAVGVKTRAEYCLKAFNNSDTRASSWIDLADLCLTWLASLDG